MKRGFSGFEAFVAVALVLMFGGIIYLGYNQQNAQTGAVAPVQGQTQQPQPIPVGTVCSATEPIKVGASVQDGITGASPPGSLNYSFNGAGWYSVSGSSTDSRSQFGRVVGLVNASPLTYFKSKVDKTLPCGSDGVTALATKIYQNTSAQLLVFNDDYTVNNQSQPKDVGSGGSADFTVRMARVGADAYFTNPDFADFGITPYFIVSSNMSSTTWDRTQVSLTATSGNVKVVDKSFIAPASASDQTIVWKVEGNLDNNAPVAQFNLHAVAKTGQNPGRSNFTMEFRPALWFHNQRMNTVDTGIEDEVGNALMTVADCGMNAPISGTICVGNKIGVFFT